LLAKVIDLSFVLIMLALKIVVLPLTSKFPFITVLFATVKLPPVLTLPVIDNKPVKVNVLAPEFRLIA
jgi:hypothetical protein